MILDQMRVTSVLFFATVACAGHLTVPVSRKRLALDRRLESRQVPPDAVLYNHATDIGVGFNIEVMLGTPRQQPTYLSVRSTSSLIQVLAPQACPNDTEIYQCGGTFNVSASASAQMQTSYSIGPTQSFFEDIYATTVVLDSLTLAGVEVNNQGIGLIEESDVPYGPFGSLGLGFQRPDSNDPPGVLDTLRDQGFIQSRTFGLHLNDLNSFYGDIVFGGYDAGRYTGTFTILPMLANTETGNFDEFRVALTSVGMTGADGSQVLTSQPFPAAARIDPFYPALLVPAATVESIVNALGAVNYDGIYYVRCSLRDSDYTVDFGLGGDGGPVVGIPLSQLIQFAYTDGEDCPLAIASVQDNGIVDAVLGEPFLSSLYALFDLDNRAVGIAPAVLNTVTSNIQSLGSGGILDIPDARVVNNTVSVQPVPTASGQVPLSNTDSDPSVTVLTALPSELAAPTSYEELLSPSFADRVSVTSSTATGYRTNIPPPSESARTSEIRTPTVTGLNQMTSVPEAEASPTGACTSIALPSWIVLLITLGFVSYLIPVLGRS